MESKNENDEVKIEKQDVEKAEKYKPEKLDTFPFRIGWYQTDAQVVVEIFAKNVVSDKLTIDFHQNEVKLNFNVNDKEEQFEKEIKLFSDIIPHKSSFKVLSTKIEMKLAKMDGGRWGDYEKKEVKPTSKTEKKNWDKLVSQIEEEAKDGDTQLNELFQKIYSEGSDEVKKAMVKSFTESGGTELNTNWDSVKKSKCDVKPPQGMEWKSWDS